MPIVQLDKTASSIPNGASILFVDTCALLEIVRLAKSDRASPTGHLDAILRVRQAQATPSARLAIVSGTILQQEWNDNQHSVLDEVTNHVKRISDNTRWVVECAQLLGQTATHPDLSALKVPIMLHNLANDMLQASFLVEATDAIRNAAFEREILGKGPAKKGSKKCIKDCVLAETLLSLARAVPRTSRGSLIFLTYNRHDFSNGSSKPHNDLAADFAKEGIEFTMNWAWAARLLGI